MSAFTWVGDLFAWVGKLFPRIVIIRKTHGGVAFRLGKYVIGLKPGIYIYWPIITDLLIHPTACQTNHLPTQSLMTKDGFSVAVGGIVRYKIVNICVALGEVWDTDDIITDISLGAISKVITQKELKEVSQNIELINEELTLSVREELSSFGVQVLAVRLANFAKCIVIRNMGSESTFFPESAIEEE